MSKNAKKYCIVVLIIAVIYNVLVFVIPYKHESLAIFWSAWALGLVAILGQLPIAYYGLREAETLKSKIYGWPIIRIGYIYLVLQIVITAIFLVLGVFFVIPFWIFVIPEVLLLGFTVIGSFICDSYREEIEKTEASAPLSIKFISDLKVDSQMLAERVMDSKVHEMLFKFAEEVKYSDPVSSDLLTEIEDEINRKYILMKDNVLNNNLDDVVNEATELLQLLKERNQRAKLGKK